MKTDNLPGLDQFLRDYPGMSIAPSRGPATVVKGTFSFTAGTNGSPKISDSYELRIEIPGDFPRDLPKVTETGSKIPRDGDHHVNLDGTICMGSPLRLLVMLSKKPDLVGFAEICLVPYLYGISDNLLNKSALPFGELRHNAPGIIDDYRDLLGLDGSEQVVQALRLLGKKQRVANKAPCPCGCGKKLGKCSFNKKLKQYRILASRSWFRNQEKYWHVD